MLPGASFSEIYKSEINQHAEAFAIASERCKDLNLFGFEVYDFLLAGVERNNSWAINKTNEGIGHLRRDESLVMLSVISDAFPALTHAGLRIAAWHKGKEIRNGKSFGTVTTSIKPEPQIAFRIEESEENYLDIIYQGNYTDSGHALSIEVINYKPGDEAELVTIPSEIQFTLLMNLPKILSKERARLNQFDRF